LALAVAATFAVVWAPFLVPPIRALEVLQRLAPLRRGLFEDYVGNFWCATSPLIKWRTLFSQEVCCISSSLVSAGPPSYKLLGLFSRAHAALAW
jgi:hypothetical protein